MNKKILLGKTTEHLVPLEGTKYFIHKEMQEDLLKLRREALSDGFDLQIISAFRDYERQLAIWNRKVSANLSEDAREVILSILRWSAMPGASRHHWGTDIDIYDGATQNAEMVKLIPEEVSNGGPASPLHDWLDKKIMSGNSFGFYRPYANDRSGVAPERWHLSYAPLSQKYFESYSLELFQENITESSMLLKDVLSQYVEEIFQRFFSNIELP